MTTVFQQQQVPPTENGLPVQTDAAFRQLALQNQQAVAIDRLVQLESDRASLVRELSGAEGAAQRPLTESLARIDNAIANTKAVIADQHQKIADLNQSSVPVPPPPRAFQQVIAIPREPGYFGMSKDEMGIGAMIILLLPLSVAIALRMVRRVSKRQVPRAESLESADRMVRLEHAVDAIALEVERISEGQRFTTKLLSERHAEPISVKAPEESLATAPPARPARS